MPRAFRAFRAWPLPASRSPHSRHFLGITVAAHISPHTFLPQALTAALGVRWCWYISVGSFLIWGHMYRPKEEKGCIQVHPMGWWLGCDLRMSWPSPPAIHFLVYFTLARFLDICFLSMPSLFPPQGLCICSSSAWQTLFLDLCKTCSFLLTCYY